MPSALTFDDRVPQFRAPVGGSSNIQFYMTLAEHTAYLAAVHDATTTAAAGWKRLFRDLQGGSIQDTFGTVTDIKNEFGEKVASTSSDDAQVIANSVMGTDSETIYAIEWLQGLADGLPVRYPLPVNAEGGYDETTTPGETIAQLWGFHAVTARKIEASITTNEGEQRVKAFELVANKKEGFSRIYEVAEVDLEDATQASWPARMAPFKDTPA